MYLYSAYFLNITSNVHISTHLDELCLVLLDSIIHFLVVFEQLAITLSQFSLARLRFGFSLIDSYTIVFFVFTCNVILHHVDPFQILFFLFFKITHQLCDGLMTQVVPQFKFSYFSL